MNARVRLGLVSLSFLLLSVGGCAEGVDPSRTSWDAGEKAPSSVQSPDDRASAPRVPAPPSKAEPEAFEPGGIREVVLSAREVCPGESVSVDIEPTDDGHEFAIDGMETESRTVQVEGAPGPRIIVVEAWPRGKRELVEVQEYRIDVRSDCDGRVLRPVLKANVGWADPHEVRLTVTNAKELAAESYVWNFGDGTSMVTRVPAVNHVYAPEALSLLRSQTIFDVRVTAQSSRGSGSATRTIAIHTPYAREKLRGVLQPPVVERARFDAEGPSVSAAIFNPEPYELFLTSVDVRVQPCDAGLDPRSLVTEPLLIAVPSRRRFAFDIDVPKPADDVCGMELYVHGTARPEENRPAFHVEIPLYAEVKRNPARTRVVDEGTAALLESLYERGLLPEDGAVTDDELLWLARSGLIEWQPRDTMRTFWAETGKVPNANEDECAPGTAEAPPQPGWVCKATNTWVRDEPYIANGHVGDIVLSASCGEIGSMLRALSVRQVYSHVGIMVQHYDAIRHSTATTKRFQDYRAGKVGTQGVIPEVLRFAQPGAITVTVEGAYHGMKWRDTKNGKEYRVGGFSQDPAYCAGDDALVYPLVVTGRTQSFADRKRIAEEAVKLRAHYRFFAYSEAKIAADRRYDMPNTLGHAIVGTQCSSFIWSAARAAGITLEGTLEESDIALGAKTAKGILDGLYFYAAAERRAAAARLYSAIYNQVSADFGLKGRIADAPDNFANQITNCFASDACELKDRNSTAWKKISTTGRTVSPQDILFWDEPYGRSEPLAYRVGTFRKVHVWQAPNGAGKLEITVRDLKGNPVSGATVTIGDLTRSTNSVGVVTTSPDAGSLHVAAKKRIGSLMYTGQATVKVVKGETTKLTLTLKPPPSTMRAVRISGSLRVKDDELWGGDKVATLDIEREISLNPAQKHRAVTFKKCAGGEARGEVELKFTLNADSSVSMTGKLLLYEGIRCNNNDREDTKSGSVQIPVGRKVTFSLKAKNSGIGGGDTATLSLTIANNQAK